MKFKKGQKVRVVNLAEQDQSNKYMQEMVGKICEIRDVFTGGMDYKYSVWTPDKTEYWYFGEENLEDAELGSTSKRNKTKSILKSIMYCLTVAVTICWYFVAILIHRLGHQGHVVTALILAGVCGGMIGIRLSDSLLLRRVRVHAREIQKNLDRNEIV